jgi:hypothetical protein
MVITSCSVGFTAFAADGNKTDKNNNYWTDDASADVIRLMASYLTNSS